MTSSLRAPVLLPGLATGIGSLPHTDAQDAAEVVLRCLPEFPAAPQLPARDPREGMLAQWLGALPEVEVGDRRLASRSWACPSSRRSASSTSRAHAGLLAFLDAASALERAPVRVKVQVTGPLTLGVALRAAGMPEPRAFRRAAEAARAWSVALEDLLNARLPHTSVVLFFDEPALVAWSRGNRAARSRVGHRRVVGRARGRRLRHRCARVR